MKRYDVRPSHSEDGMTLYRVFDQAKRVHTGLDFTRLQLAESCAARLNADHARRLRMAPTVGQAARAAQEAGGDAA